MPTVETVDRIATSLAEIEGGGDAAALHPSVRHLLDPRVVFERTSDADDWSDLNDRMHFIADLFRAYQEWPQLFDPAFTPAQVMEIKAGRKPDGRL